MAEAKFSKYTKCVKATLFVTMPSKVHDNIFSTVNGIAVLKILPYIQVTNLRVLITLKAECGTSFESNNIHT